MRRRHGVDGQQVERGRAIDEDIGVVSVPTRIAAPAPSAWRRRKVRSGIAGDLQLDAEQIERRRRDRNPGHGGRQRDVVDASPRRAADRRSTRLRLLRSMPRPVEALPCGSRSTISTSSPIAASAVPRLIAVVVLPTPPFWLARAMTRGVAGRLMASCPAISLLRTARVDFENHRAVARFGFDVLPDRSPRIERLRRSPARNPALEERGRAASAPIRRPARSRSRGAARAPAP